MKMLIYSSKMSLLSSLTIDAFSKILSNFESSRASQFFGIFGPTVFCVQLNKWILMRPSLGRLGVIFDGGQASKVSQSKEWFLSNVDLDWSALEAWPPSKMTPNLPNLSHISFHSLSRTQKTVGPKITKNWNALVSTQIFNCTATISNYLSKINH